MIQCNKLFLFIKRSDFMPLIDLKLVNDVWTLNLSMIQTVGLAVITLFIGTWINKHSKFLQRMCMPAPAVGALPFAGTVTGIVEPAGMHLWAWWKDTCVKECIVKVNGADISSALIEMEEMLQRFGVEEIQGIHFYNTDVLNEEQRIDISALQEVYGNTEYIPMMFLGRGRTRCTLGELDWDMAIGMATRGLRWIGQGW